MLPWSETVSTHLHAWFGGNEVGNGLANVLFGAVNPSGKLRVSFPPCIEDTPTYLSFGSDRDQVIYGEGIYVGYRYYEKLRKDVLYPFGYGLSYTTFNYSDPYVTTSSVTLNVSNSGTLAGTETVQFYISPDKLVSIVRPVEELKGFAKVYLQPGGISRVEIALERFSTAFWNQELHKWAREKGQYMVLVGPSSQNVLLEGVLDVEKTTMWSGL